MFKEKTFVVNGKEEEDELKNRDRQMIPVMAVRAIRDASTAAHSSAPLSLPPCKLFTVNDGLIVIFNGFQDILTRE